MTRTPRHRRSWLVGLGLLLILGLALGLRMSLGFRWRSDATKDLDEAGALELSSEPPEGRYANAEEGARYEEERRQEAIELSRREERGPIRCLLEARPAASALRQPELRVRLVNRSDEAVTLWYNQFLLEHVTFIFRDPDDRVVGTFCYAHVPSLYRSRSQLPVTTLKPGEADTSTLYLSVASGRNFQRLWPGRYSLEATFQYRDRGGFPSPNQQMLARSERIPIRVVAGAE